MTIGPLIGRPLHLIVRDVVAERIISGEWKPGFEVPDESDLAGELGVSAEMVRKALEVLELDGLIVRVPGRGWIVSERSPNGAGNRAAVPREPADAQAVGPATPSTFSKGLANSLERGHLQLSAEQDVYRIRRERRRSGQVFLVAHATLPASLFPGLAGRSDAADHIANLAPEYGIELGKAIEHASVVPVPAHIAHSLCVAPSTSVMLLDRTVLMRNGRPAEWSMSYCHLAGVQHPDG